MINLLLALTVTAATPPDARALALVDTAIARMGGRAALSGIERMRLEMLTEWLRVSADRRPFSDLPSYERHSEVRDYTLPAWRNTRLFVPPPAPSPRSVIDVVTDSAAMRSFGRGWNPLNVAYVDERRELFTFTPERVLLLARAAEDLRALPDTSIDGMAHARVSGTIGGFPATLFLRHSDGLPAMFRYRAAHENDFGLVPLGEMDVEVWYSNWQTVPPGVHLPMQWDVRRAGQAYKRMSVLVATVNPPATPDSFAISDSLRTAFRANASRAMHDVTIDSARTAMAGRVVYFNVFAGPPGAVRIGSQWVIVEAGQAPLNAQRALAWLAGNEGGAAVAAAVLTNSFVGNGGIVTLVRERITVHAAPGAVPLLHTNLAGHGQRAEGITPITGGRWLRVDADSLYMEPIDLPNARGSAFVYVPSLEWIYSANAVTPLDRALLLAIAEQRRWKISYFGNARGFVVPLAAGN